MVDSLLGTPKIDRSAGSPLCSIPVVPPVSMLPFTYKRMLGAGTLAPDVSMLRTSLPLRRMLSALQWVMFLLVSTMHRPPLFWPAVRVVDVVMSQLPVPQGAVP